MLLPFLRPPCPMRLPLSTPYLPLITPRLLLRFYLRVFMVWVSCWSSYCLDESGFLAWDSFYYWYSTMIHWGSILSSTSYSCVYDVLVHV